MKTSIIALALAGAFIGTNANAQVPYVTTVSTSATWYSAPAPGASAFITGMQTLWFYKSAGVGFGVSFNAKCAVEAPAGNYSAYSDIDIYVRNYAGAIIATLAPTAGTTDSFCSANGSAAMDGWAMHSINVPAMLQSAPAGYYRVEVWAGKSSAASRIGFSHRSLTVTYF